ncbi:hypothetical protein [Spirosoma luteum]|uniref:hypothetical protein n=1 Tax=Spirosoma luteum TaxID=431553 RepID=UPI000363B085|nr:hypothetical protein [Spirosoma luteum]
MKPKQKIMAVCCVVQTVHATPALEAGQVIFKEHPGNMVALVVLQVLLGITLFLYYRNWVTTPVKHRYKMNQLCIGAGIYLALVTLAEVIVITFGSPFSQHTTQFLAHSSMWASGLIALSMWEKINLR